MPGAVSVAASLCLFVVIASAAEAQVSEFQVNSSPPTTGPYYARPAVAADPQGRFVVAWGRYESSTWSIRGRLFDAAGVPQGPDFVLASSSAAPSVSYEANGGFVVVWVGGPAGSPGIVGRR